MNCRPRSRDVFSRAAATLSIILALSGSASAAVTHFWKLDDNAASTTVVATVGSNGLRGDGAVVENAAFILVDEDSGPGVLRGRITGSFTQASDHQIVRVKDHEPGRSDWQIDIHEMGDEEGAYPLRPTRGQWVPRRREPELFANTVFFFNADRDYPDGRYVESNWSVNPGTGAITTGADESASGNVLTIDGTDSTIVRGQINCRDGVLFSSDRLIDTTPTGVGSSFNDITIACVVKPTSAGNRRIVGCTDPDGTDGWYIDTDSTNHVQCHFGTNADLEVTSSAQLETDRPNIVVVERDDQTSSATWRITINGVLESFSGKSGGTIPAVLTNGAIAIGQRQSGSGSTWIEPFAGYIGTVIVDEDDFAAVTLDGSTITASTDAAGKTLTLANYQVDDTEEGQWLVITSGTNFTPGIYQIMVANEANDTWTLNRDVSTTPSTPASGLVGVLKDDDYSARLRYLRQFGAW